jgi:tagaturonate reductase
MTNKIDKSRPADSIQFGEGNFMRAFVDFCIQLLNEQTSFQGKVDVVQPIAQGMIENLADQNGKYHVYSEGILNGKSIRKSHLINCIDQMVDPYQNFEKYLSLAENENLKFVFSNTTEAGIQQIDTDQMEMQPPSSFPAKLVLLLLRRFEKFNGSDDKVLHIIPCELIEKNGDTLKAILLNIIDQWELEIGFKNWVMKNHFYNTLVDRIVPGFPKDNLALYQQDLSFEDNLIVTCEPFFLWVIEGNPKLLDVFPADQLSEIDVKVVKDLGNYRTRKVRILNGCHTAMVPIGLLKGVETVSAALSDEFMKEFISETLKNEIIPSIDFDKEELTEYAAQVLERFSNPFTVHQLQSIALNSISKYKVRVLPSLLSFYKKNNSIPKNLTFALASLIYFYGKDISKHSYSVKDDTVFIDFFKNIWKMKSTDEISETVLSNELLWGQNLAKINPIKKEISLILKLLKNKNLVAAFEDYKST